MEIDNSSGLLNAYRPGLEEAGLEDSALPSHAIQKAFRRAADSLQKMPWRLHLGANGNHGDADTGNMKFERNPSVSYVVCNHSLTNPKEMRPFGEEQSCVGMKIGGRIIEGSDLVATAGAGIFEGDKLVVGKESGPKLGDVSCVEGLPGDKGVETKVTFDETDDGSILVLA